MAKIKISDLRDTYYNASSTVSDIVRQISIVGIGVIWIFVEVINDTLLIDKCLVCSIVLFLGSLLFDALQYTYKTIVFACLFRKAEKEFDNNEDAVLDKSTLLHPGWNAVTWIFWTLKIILTICGYIALLIYLIKDIQLT